MIAADAGTGECAGGRVVYRDRLGSSKARWGAAPAKSGLVAGAVRMSTHEVLDCD